jgi:apolipoprotein N-acyltransferase
VIDPLGRIDKLLPLGVEGILDTQLPRRIAPPVYAHVGDAPVFIFLGLLAMVVFRYRQGR